MSGRTGWSFPSVRPAVIDDLTAIQRVVEAAYLPWVPVLGSLPAPLSADHGALVAAGAVHVAGLQGVPHVGGLDGVIVLRPETGALCIENVAVHPCCQGRGLGRRLLAFAEEKAHERGLAEMRLYTHERMLSNLRLYANVGYEEVSREDIGGGQLVHLRKSLSIGWPGTEP